jgi:hypothetical protein
MAFHHRCGQNIRLSHENTVALRIESYNKGVVYSKDPLEIGEPFLIRFDQKEGGWAGGLVSYVIWTYIHTYRQTDIS